MRISLSELPSDVYKQLTSSNITSLSLPPSFPLYLDSHFVLSCPGMTDIPPSSHTIYNAQSSLSQCHNPNTVQRSTPTVRQLAPICSRQLVCARLGIYNNTSVRRCTDFRLNPLPLTIVSSQRTNSLHKPHVFSRDMADHSRSTRFRARFMSALEAYKQTTGVTLIEHPLAVQLQNCHSVESITTLLKYEARPFSGLLGSDGMLASIESIVSILSTLSSSAPFGEAIGVVRQNALVGCSISLSVFSAIPAY